MIDEDVISSRELLMHFKPRMLQENDLIGLHSFRFSCGEASFNGDEIRKYEEMGYIIIEQQHSYDCGNAPYYRYDIIATDEALHMLRFELL